MSVCSDSSREHALLYQTPFTVPRSGHRYKYRSQVGLPNARSDQGNAYHKLQSLEKPEIFSISAYITYPHTLTMTHYYESEHAWIVERKPRESKHHHHSYHHHPSHQYYTTSTVTVVRPYTTTKHFTTDYKGRPVMWKIKEYR